MGQIHICMSLMVWWVLFPVEVLKPRFADVQNPSYKTKVGNEIRQNFPLNIETHVSFDFCFFGSYPFSLFHAIKGQTAYNLKLKEIGYLASSYTFIILLFEGKGPSLEAFSTTGQALNFDIHGFCSFLGQKYTRVLPACFKKFHDRDWQWQTKGISVQLNSNLKSCRWKIHKNPIGSPHEFKEFIVTSKFNFLHSEVCYRRVVYTYE